MDKEKRKGYNENYYKKHHDKILQLHKNKKRCEICNTDIGIYRFKLHLTSRKHTERMKELNLDPEYTEELQRVREKYDARQKRHADKKKALINKALNENKKEESDKFDTAKGCIDSILKTIPDSKTAIKCILSLCENILSEQ